MCVGHDAARPDGMGDGSAQIFGHLQNHFPGAGTLGPVATMNIDQVGGRQQVCRPRQSSRICRQIGRNAIFFRCPDLNAGLIVALI